MMKALSLTQPWASLMAQGAKRIETRHAEFPRRHLGELAIVSSINFPEVCRALTAAAPFSQALKFWPMPTWQREWGVLPRGAVLAVVEVVAYARTQDCFDEHRKPRILDRRDFEPAEHEVEFGDYSRGRTAILTRNARQLSEPVRAERLEAGRAKPGGALGIWQLSPACEAAVREQMVRP